ncbi:hypothetical protein GOBAR_AA20070 [Gossypium barbadense]|uniref:Uncharacterized protein n=1 Tax=Gossypium barbadense TaxID=3634 RepID=A0A2P5XB90_GOSBA|nr:hypothetical protein GOBAR_AA20070 [Gossypium barbadense]
MACNSGRKRPRVEERSQIAEDNSGVELIPRGHEKVQVNPHKEVSPPTVPTIPESSSTPTNLTDIPALVLASSLMGSSLDTTHTILHTSLLSSLNYTSLLAR